MKKRRRKNENHEICHDVMISYMELVVKKLRRFHTFCHTQCLDVKASHKKNHSVEEDRIRFRIKRRSNCDLTTKLFLYTIENIDYFI